MPRRRTLDQFLQAAKAQFGDTYDYSRVQYINGTSKVTIICKEHGEFEQTPTAHICNRNGCPYCAGRKACSGNSLESKYPHIAKEWHPTKNGTLCPSEVVARSNKKVWWQCGLAKEHVWQASPDSRVRNQERTPHRTGCPICSGDLFSESNSLAKTHPHIAKQWHPTKNGNLQPTDVVAKTGRKAWWLCPVSSEHVWQTRIVSRIGKRESGCPYCAKYTRKVLPSTSLAATHPEIASQWHPTKNTLTPDDVLAGSKVKVWWQCPVAPDHVYLSSVAIRTKGNDCACCRGLQVVLSNSLATTHPKVASLWHPTKNKITPYDVVAGTHKRAWWICDKGHEWRATVHNVSQGSGCPVCRESKGEVLIADVLSKLGLRFRRQQRFRSCKYKRMLPFDFIVKIRGLCAIEYQGAQHYQPVKWSKRWSEEKANAHLRVVQRKDEIKRRWCETNGLPLLEIPYWQKENIELIVKEFLERTHETIQTND